MSPQTKRMRITVDGKHYDVAVEMLPEPSATPMPVAWPPPATASSEPRPQAPSAPALARANGVTAAGAVFSPLAGVVLSVDVTVGSQVKAGDLLVTLEAMKMKTPVYAPAAGTVRSIEAKPTLAVEEGAVLLVLG